MDEFTGAVQPSNEQGSGRGTQLGIGNDDVFQRNYAVVRHGRCGYVLMREFGYPRVLAGIAGMALVAALLFKSFD